MSDNDILKMIQVTVYESDPNYGEHWHFADELVCYSAYPHVPWSITRIEFHVPWHPRAGVTYP